MKFDGQSITYDASGNPTSYYNGTRWTFGWSNGRNLTSASGGGKTLSFTYDLQDGTRATKTVGTEVHNYIYAGGKLLRETYGNTTLDFIYDVNGRPYAMIVNESTTYYYITNLQGDVINVVNSSGTIVASYEYDPYGYPVVQNEEDLGFTNPLRYRGYYWDAETKLYYLQSRYYDPAVGRFINADSYASTGQGFLGFNMFVYCGSNPVCFTDNSGHSYQFFSARTFDPEHKGGAGGAIPVPIPNLKEVAECIAGIGLALYAFLNDIIPSTIEASSAKPTIRTEEKEDTQVLAITSESHQYQYWEAMRLKNEVIIGRGLSFSEAQLRVSCGLDIMCANQGAALWLVICNGYWNAAGPEIHGDEGYYWHYHPNRNSHTHIWYY